MAKSPTINDENVVNLSQVDVGPLVGLQRLEAFQTYLEKSLESGLLINEMNICGDKDKCVTLTLT